MGQEDNEKNSGHQPESELKCDKEQYEMLKRCSDKKDMAEWNEWRKNNPDKDVLLEGVNFSKWYLKGAYLNKGKLVYGYDFTSLGEVHLDNTIFHKADLENARFVWSRLKDAKFANANLKKTDFQGAHIQGTNFYGTNLQDANFATILIDNATSFWEIIINKNTNFLGVSLASIRIHPKIRLLLEYNIRRKNWEDWYEEHPKMKWLVKPFWLMSDYGLSTGRIIITFLGLAIIFANIYYHWARIAPPGIVSNLLVDENGAAVPFWLVPLRTLYFSIVTMTTLGFGDMYARGQSIFGYFLLMVQVIFGYVLLGALVTRFAVLFTAGGPAGKFSPIKIKEAGEDKKHKE